MANVCDVGAHVLARMGAMTTMKLQKLAYYAYCYHLVWSERQLFPQRFEAWANGPVSPALYAQHRGQFRIEPGELAGDPNALTPDERDSVDIVVENLGKLSAHQLSSMTHREPPWVRARERAGAAGLERCAEELSDADIAEYFEALVGAAESQGGPTS